MSVLNAIIAGKDKAPKAAEPEPAPEASKLASEQPSMLANRYASKLASYHDSKLAEPLWQLNVRVRLSYKKRRKVWRLEHGLNVQDIIEMALDDWVARYPTTQIPSLATRIPSYPHP